MTDIEKLRRDITTLEGQIAASRVQIRDARKKNDDDLAKELVTALEVVFGPRSTGNDIKYLHELKADLTKLITASGELAEQIDEVTKEL